MIGVQRAARIETLHILNGVNGHAALAHLTEHAVGVAVQAVKRRAIERRAEPMRALVARQIMEPLVRILSQH